MREENARAEAPDAGNLLCPLPKMRFKDFFGPRNGKANHRRRIEMPDVRTGVRRPKGKAGLSGPRIIDEAERPLRDRPDRFAEIFGDAQYPSDAVRKLMAAVALTVVKDYFARPTEKMPAPQRERVIADKRSAECFIFQSRQSTEHYVFSFPAICKSLGIDPGFARRGIRKRSPSDIRGIVQRLTCHKADWDGDD